MDSSLGPKDFKGGLSAILTQLNSNGQFLVIAFVSQLLLAEEKQLSPFLLEMRAMVWATRNFQQQLRGQKVILITNHKLLQTCAESN